MAIFYCVPSARPPQEAERCFAAWRDMGYEVVTWTDAERGRPYPGYAVAVNTLISEVMSMFHLSQWFVTGGDDVFPDPTKRADEIAAECGEHFASTLDISTLNNPNRFLISGATFGVMQPTGDGHGIDTICGSPWIGREFIQAIKGCYAGVGPFWPEYTHCFGDNELQDMAKALNRFWQRPDLTHRHEHWSWTGKPMPEFLKEANSPEHWEKYQAIYLRRKAAGFPGL